jgi:hypothetical protein
MTGSRQAKNAIQKGRYLFFRTDAMDVYYKGVLANVFRFEIVVDANGDITMADPTTFYLNPNPNFIQLDPIDGSSIWAIEDYQEDLAPYAYREWQLVEYDDNFNVVGNKLKHSWDPWARYNRLYDYQRETITTGTNPYDTGQSSRLIPFSFSTDDNYVMLFGENTLGFSRTVGGVSGRIQE